MKKGEEKRGSFHEGKEKEREGGKKRVRLGNTLAFHKSWKSKITDPRRSSSDNALI